MDSPPPVLAALYALAEASLGAATGQEAASLDARLTAALDERLQPGRGEQLARLFALAPSPAVYRHLWRLLVECERSAPREEVLAATLFAMPVIVVAALDADAAPTTLPGTLADVAALHAILRTHGALQGNASFALADALVGPETLAFEHLPALLAWRKLPDAPAAPRALVPVPITVEPGPEAVHLRFIVGTALAASGRTLLRDTTVGKWGIPFAQQLARVLAVPGVSVLALPRAPQSLLAASAQGRAAQREVAAQIFASNALRRLRASVGEPIAEISVHRLAEPQPAGEVRLSLASPFGIDEPECFRSRLFPLDRADDVVKMLTDLLRACRVRDVRVLPASGSDRQTALQSAPIQ